MPIAVFQHKGVVLVRYLTTLFSHVWHWHMPVMFVPPVNCTSEIVFCRVRVVIYCVETYVENERMKLVRTLSDATQDLSLLLLSVCIYFIVATEPRDT